MYIVSMKLTRRRKIIVLCAAFALVLAGVLGVIHWLGDDSVSASGKVDPKLTQVKSNEDRIKFIQQYGWTVTEEPVEIKEVIIPKEFDDTYEQYNTIQKSQGFDLSRYQGKTAKRYTYAVTNSPNRQGVLANLLVVDEKVVGGDLCSSEPNGILHGFSLQEEAEAELQSSQAA